MAILGSDNTLALTFGLLGNIFSFLVYLAPMPTFFQIYKRKSTEGFQSLPYLVALFSSMLWLYYAFVKTDAILLITTNSVGCVMEIIYIFMYIIYAPKDARSLSIKLFVAMNVGSFTLILLIIHFAIPVSLRVKIVGWICVFISVSVFAAPLSIVVSTGYSNKECRVYAILVIIFFLTLSAIVWSAYGAFLKDICIAIPNVLGFTLGLLQMLLYAVYRKSGTRNNGVTEEREQSLESVRNIVGIPLRTHEVSPIQVNDDDDVKEQGKVGAKDAEEKENSVKIKECLV